MPHEFDSARPIYHQLCELMTQRIVSGAYAPGQKLPGVRELALQYGVNPNTAQRTMAELEQQGLVHSERTAGRFVTTDIERIAQIRREAAMTLVDDFLQRMEQLGFTRAQVREILEKQEGEV